MQEWKTYSKNDVAAGLQSFLICIEMFFAALAHAYAFPPRDYMDPTVQPPPSFLHSLRIMFDVRDVVDDVHGVVDDTVSRTGCMRRHSESNISSMSSFKQYNVRASRGGFRCGKCNWACILTSQ